MRCQTPKVKRGTEGLYAFQNCYRSKCYFAAVIELSNVGAGRLFSINTKSVLYLVFAVLRKGCYSAKWNSSE